MIVSHRSSLRWLHRSCPDTIRHEFLRLPSSSPTILICFFHWDLFASQLIQKRHCSCNSNNSHACLPPTGIYLSPSLILWPFPVSLHPQTFKTWIGISLAISEIAFTHRHYTDFTNGGSEPASPTFLLCVLGSVLRFPEFSEVTKPNVLWY